MQGRVKGKAGRRATEAVVLRREQHVVPCREALELRPADPARGERALVAARLQFGRGENHLRPGLGRLFGVQAGGLEGVLVVIEDRGRTVERQAQHLTARRRVIACHCRDVGLGIELRATHRHHFADRLDRAFGSHHRGRADFIDLQDVRRVAGAECGHGGGEGLTVASLVGGDDDVVLLGGVEILCQIVHPFAERTAHGMPPLNLGLGLGGQGETQARVPRRKFSVSWVLLWMTVRVYEQFVTVD